MMLIPEKENGQDEGAELCTVVVSVCVRLRGGRPPRVRRSLGLFLQWRPLPTTGNHRGARLRWS